ncbi:zinc-ribbon domain-containing protein [Arenibacterium halophilum]|uniref:Thioredoxin n=1 Tax=Arenibacterium halophilum TaxID=2583821 RepID=A0ABY2XDW9_9RHOB|nr:zinc-ribbon domain-containing protein [Arenibacterium halophilum]TMV15215.1 thioredoxin [Arenibacterium halophilum]
MRIACPNCGAQYEVPDEVIPEDGRDVQCSNCSDTWFQPRNGDPIRLPADSGLQESDDAPAVSVHADEEQTDSTPDPELAMDVTPHTGTAPPDDDDTEEEPGDVPRQRRLDPGVADILREEARHESRLRASESTGLESQGDLGLDSVGEDEASKRSQQARDRMARLRGTPATPPPGAPRGDLLPDIEEIKSTLAPDDRDVRMAPGPVQMVPVRAPRRSGFLRGFSVMILLTVGLVLLYMNASQVTEAVPALSDFVANYVTVVDKARIWLDQNLSGFIPN